MFRGAGRPLDEAAAKMRASGIDALAAPVGERARPVAPEQRRQPARHVAAHHVGVAAIGRTARGEMGTEQHTPRSAERRVGKECAGQSRSRWSTSSYTNTQLEHECTQT